MCSSRIFSHINAALHFKQCSILATTYDLAVMAGLEGQQRQVLDRAAGLAGLQQQTDRRDQKQTDEAAQRAAWAARSATEHS